jgi:hypothetical protein
VGQRLHPFSSGALIAIDRARDKGRQQKGSKKPKLANILARQSKSQRKAAQHTLESMMRTLRGTAVSSSRPKRVGIVAGRQVLAKGYFGPVNIVSVGPETVRFSERGGPIRSMSKIKFRALVYAAAGKEALKSRKRKHGSVWTISTRQGGQPGFRR